ncbi:pseudouridine synthase [Coccomyxa subellipsoidea C-169]|uniref:Pseudouridine synthase n=1 Tax=Coccomyxa subellipsoidea (strain C-169) TaxID=574566 RepID=I0Z189_COCSC|nr:pseudouridine synthase [Coccomyxa subellipsoidea C-169]EIE24408.1 pseudouridine synthase [Coccomyxa subellipsoidea C-169]|eukprot:XP_005648952.1 pseudouridine synthase [Coccomyxa subellipsoidea C-169]
MNLSDLSYVLHPLQAAIRDGFVRVNEGVPSKPGLALRPGDVVACRLPPLPSLEASPEDIPLDVVYEDDHLLVINKAAGMVIHPAPGNYTGTLVSALLHRFGLPSVRLSADDSPGDELEAAESEDGDEERAVPWALPETPMSVGQSGDVIRPGIVHRLDKGTTGLMVAAKDERTLTGLAAQFKAHTVQRVYHAIVLGVPKEAEGVIETNIGRDIRDRKKMGVFSYMGRHAVSGYRVIEPLAGDSAAYTAWRLQTGRTHQIRVTNDHRWTSVESHPLLGDDTYGGAGGTAVAAIGRGKGARQVVAHRVLKLLARPALHAKTLGFVHPVTKEALSFTSELPTDFATVLEELRNLD